MKDFEQGIPAGFAAPTALPTNTEEQQRWQAANRAWWESHPMTYDWNQPIDQAPFTPNYYQEIDKRFFADAAEYLPSKSIPFDALIDFQDLADKDVLEIGVGNGSHAALLAKHAKSFTGIDLTEHAARSTSARMNCFGLNGRILQMDAEKLDFPDHSFDFIWSWGVIHHSANTRQVLEEMRRVLRPNGKAVVMVYHRNFLNYYIMAGLCHGILRGDLWKTRSLHQTMQRRSDGAIARYYTKREWQALASEQFHVERIAVYGSKSHLLPLPAGRLKSAVRAGIPDAVGRFLANTCSLGEFLVSWLSPRDGSASPRA